MVAKPNGPRLPGNGRCKAGERLPEPVLDTRRLLLRELTLADTDSLLEILSDPVGMQWYPQTYNRQETESWIQRARESYAQYGHGFWATVLKGSGQFAGICGVLHSVVEDVEEKALGWLILRRFWNQGFATEASQACLDYGFRVLGRERIISMIRPENMPSQHVARKLGMSLEREVPWKGYVHGVWAKERAKAEGKSGSLPM
jgi:RimJ/RimL family protein N-acetyltransferase